jgi:uncharacterized membrane protein
MSEPLTREQVEQLAACFPADLLHRHTRALLEHDAALREERDQWKETFERSCDDVKALHRRVEELERDQHKPTVTYWMNLFTLMQQEAKKRFDDWFVLRQQVDDLTAKLAKVMEENADMKAQLTQESQDAINKQVIIDGLRSERARHTAQLADLTEQLAQAQQDLADLPTLRKDLSMCLIQLQDARGRILSMESEVDMVRAQLDARRT